MSEWGKVSESPVVLSNEKIKLAQLTIVELCDFGEGAITRDEMTDLINMITPTNQITVLDVGTLNGHGRK